MIYTINELVKVINNYLKQKSHTIFELHSTNSTLLNEIFLRAVGKHEIKRKYATSKKAGYRYNIYEIHNAFRDLVNDNRFKLYCDAIEEEIQRIERRRLPADLEKFRLNSLNKKLESVPINLIDLIEYTNSNLESVGLKSIKSGRYYEWVYTRKIQPVKEEGTLSKYLLSDLLNCFSDLRKPEKVKEVLKSSLYQFAKEKIYK